MNGDEIAVVIVDALGQGGKPRLALQALCGGPSDLFNQVLFDLEAAGLIAFSGGVHHEEPHVTWYLTPPGDQVLVAMHGAAARAAKPVKEQYLRLRVGPDRRWP